MRGFGDKLRAAAKIAGCNGDAEAARRCKVDIRAYGNYANGRIPKDPETLIRICRTFGTTPNHLFGFEIADYQQEAAAIAERLTADNRVLWFHYGRASVQQPPARAASPAAADAPHNAVHRILSIIKQAVARWPSG